MRTGSCACLHTHVDVCTRVDRCARTCSGAPPAAGGPRALAAHRLALCPAPGPPQRGHCEVVGVLTVSNLRLLNQGLQFPLGDVFHTLPMGGGLQQPGPGWRRSPALRAAAVTHPRTWGWAAGLLGAGPAPPRGSRRLGLSQRPWLQPPSRAPGLSLHPHGPPVAPARHASRPGCRQRPAGLNPPLECNPALMPPSAARRCPGGPRRAPTGYPAHRAKGRGSVPPAATLDSESCLPSSSGSGVPSGLGWAGAGQYLAGQG